MADFKTPNLCGANEQFNNLLSTFESLESDLLNGLESACITDTEALEEHFGKELLQDH